MIPLEGVLAEAIARAGVVADGLAAIEDALDRSERVEECVAIPELLRVRGEILRLQTGREAAAEASFRQAIDWARRQGALYWELRAATSLARLLGDQGGSADATAILQPVYDRFTEGFETADLRAAKTVLDNLS